MEDNKTEIIKMRLQKTNQEKDLDMKKLKREILGDASVGFTKKGGKNSKGFFKYQKVMKNEIL